MSTRWYPRYVLGNPQLRVFLPNFFMKLIKPKIQEPPNVVCFKVSTQMTNFDVKNYLEKIYNVPVAEVRTKIFSGKIRRALGKQYLVKDDDYKVAFVTLTGDQTFSFPDLYPEAKITEEYHKIKKQEKMFKEEGMKKIKYRNDPHRQDVPTWFEI